MVKRKKERKEDKGTFALAIVLLSICIIVLFVTFFLPKDKVLDEKEYPIRLVITNKTAFNLTDDAIDLGGVMQGTSIYKNVILYNPFDTKVFVLIETTGNVSDFLVFEPVINLEPEENKTIEISTITIPENATFGRYSGKLIIKFYEAQ